jgi:hypothetical protein
MLQNIKELYRNKLAALDGGIGHVQDFYFDDKTWVIRYLVADTGPWLAGRLVLLTPHVLGELDPDEKTLQVKLSKKQIADSPSIESHKPVSRQYEIDYYHYYGLPAYWDGGAMWGLSGYPSALLLAKDKVEARAPHHHRDDKHLQSTQAVTGYHIQTADGVIGHLSGMMVDDQSWAIRELVVEAGHWYSGKEILISPDKVVRISYEDSKVFVNLTKAEIQQAGENELVEAATETHGAGHFRD